MNEIPYAFMIDGERVGFMLVQEEVLAKGYKRSVITKFKAGEQIVFNPFYYIVDEVGLVTSVSRDDTNYQDMPLRNRQNGYPGCAYAEALQNLKLEVGNSQKYKCLEEDSGEISSEIQLTVAQKLTYKNPLTGIVTELYKVEESAYERFFLIDYKYVIHCINWGGSAESVLVESSEKILKDLPITP